MRFRPRDIDEFVDQHLDDETDFNKKASSKKKSRAA
jgi:hypothetical protein